MSDLEPTGDLPKPTTEELEAAGDALLILLEASLQQSPGPRIEEFVRHIKAMKAERGRFF